MKSVEEISKLLEKSIKELIERDDLGLNDVDRIIVEDWEGITGNVNLIIKLMKKVPPKYLFGLYMEIRARLVLGDNEFKKVIEEIEKDDEGKGKLKELCDLFKDKEDIMQNESISDYREKTGPRRERYLEKMAEAKKNNDIKELINNVGKLYYRAPLKASFHDLKDCDPYTCMNKYFRDIHGATHAIQASKDICVLYDLIKSFGIDPKWPPENKTSLTKEDLDLISFATAYHDSARIRDGMDYWDMQSAENFRRDAIKLGFDLNKVNTIAYSMAMKDEKSIAFENNNKPKNWISILINGADGFEVIRCRKQYKKDSIYTNGFKYNKLFINDALINSVAKDKVDAVNKKLEQFTIRYSRWINFCARNYMIFVNNPQASIVRDFRKDKIENQGDISKTLDTFFEKYKTREIVAKISRLYKTNGRLPKIKNIEKIVKKYAPDIKNLSYFDAFTKDAKDPGDKYKALYQKILSAVKENIVMDKQPISAVHKDDYSWNDIEEIFKKENTERILMTRTLVDRGLPQITLKHELEISDHIKNNHYERNNIVRYNKHWLVNTTAILHDKYTQLLDFFPADNAAFLVYVGVDDDIYEYWPANAYTNIRIEGSFKNPSIVKALGKNKRTIADIKDDLEKHKKDEKRKIFNEILCKNYPPIIGVGVRMVDENKIPNPKQCARALSFLHSMNGESFGGLKKNNNIYIVGFYYEGKIKKLVEDDLIKTIQSQVTKDNFMFNVLFRKEDISGFLSGSEVTFFGDTKDLDDLVEQFKKSCTSSTLSLYCDKFGGWDKDKAKVFIGKLESFGVTILDLKLDGEAVDTFILGLEELKDSGITTLNLANSGIEEWNKKQIEDFISELRKTSINILRLDSEKFETWDCEKVQAFISGLKKSGVTTIGLGLTGDKLGELKIANFIKVLKGTGVTAINLDEKELQTLAEKGKSEGLINILKNTGVDNLVLSEFKKLNIDKINNLVENFIKALKGSSITTLKLNDEFTKCDINNIGVLAKGLKDVGIYNLSLGDGCWKWQEEKDLKNFTDKLGKFEIITLNLSYSQLDEWGKDKIEYFTSWLKNSGIIALDLSNNKLSPWFYDEEKIQAFTDGLKKSNITALNLSGNSLYLNDIITFLKKSQTSAITTLNLSNNHLYCCSDGTELKQLGEVLKISSVTSLDLSNNEWGTVYLGTSGFMQELRNSKVTALNLSGNELGKWENKDIEGFFDTKSESSQDHCITTLDLSNNQLDIWSSDLIGSFIDKLNNFGVVSLCLNGNNIDQWDSNKIKAFISGLKKTNITTLNLTTDFENWKGAVEFIKALKDTNVTTLALTGKELRKWEKGSITNFAASLKNSCITTLSLVDGFGMWKTKEIEEFIIALKGSDIATINLGNEFVNCDKGKMESIIKCLKDNGFTTLSLSGDLLKWEKKNVKFTSLLKNSGINKLSLSDGCWKWEKNEIETFTSGLENSEITKLNLGNNQLGEWDKNKIEYFTTGLKGKGITTLDLSSNGLDKWNGERIKAFASGLMNSGITEINLSGNNIDKWGSEEITLFTKGLKDAGIIYLLVTNMDNLTQMASKAGLGIIYLPALEKNLLTNFNLTKLDCPVYEENKSLVDNVIKRNLLKEELNKTPASLENFLKTYAEMDPEYLTDPPINRMKLMELIKIDLSGKNGSMFPLLKNMDADEVRRRALLEFCFKLYSVQEEQPSKKAQLVSNIIKFSSLKLDNQKTAGSLENTLYYCFYGSPFSGNLNLFSQMPKYNYLTLSKRLSLQAKSTKNVEITNTVNKILENPDTDNCQVTMLSFE